MNIRKSNRLAMTFGVGLMVLATFFLYMVNEKSTGEVNIQIGESLSGMADELNDNVARFQLLAGLIADNRALFYRGSLSLPDANSSTLAKILNEKYVTAICCVDKSGKVFGITKGGKVEKNLDKSDMLETVLSHGGRDVKTIRKSLFEDKIVMNIMMPVIKTESISFEGMSGIELDISSLFNDIQQKNIKFSGQYFMAVSRDMKVLMTKDKDKINKSIKDFKVVQLNEDKISGKASFFDDELGVFRILEFPTVDVKLVSFIPIKAIKAKNINAIVWKVLYVVGVLLLSISVTQIIRHLQKYKKQSEDIKRLRKEIDILRTREDEKNELIATSLHEIKTPLYAMTGIARSLIERSALSQDARNSLYMVVTTGKRIANMISNVSDYSGKNILSTDFKICPVSIREIAGNVFYILTALTTGKEITLGNDIPEDFPNILADNEQLEQALINIIGNSIKFSHHGQIKVSAEKNEKKATIIISDNGIGLNPDKLDTINAALKSPSLNIDPDLGIGLNITKKIIKLHEGEIYMESKLNVGTTVYFTMKLETAKVITHA